jgi:hypothetical protein
MSPEKTLFFPARSLYLLRQLYNVGVQCSTIHAPSKVSVSDQGQDPDWIQIQLGHRIRVQAGQHCIEKNKIGRISSLSSLEA